MTNQYIEELKKLQQIDEVLADFDTYFDGHWGWSLPAEYIDSPMTTVGVPSSLEVKEYVKAFIRDLLAKK